MFRAIFRPYGLVWTLFNDITDVLLLSLLWCVCCLPIITIAPATTALYDAAVHGIRYREGEVCRRFFRTFRNEWKTGIPVTLLWGVILVFGSWMLAMLNAIGTQDTRTALIAGAYHAVLVIPIAAACWSAVILSRFTYRFGALTAVSLRYLPGHPLASAFLGITAWLAFWFCNENPLALTFAPALCALIWSIAAEPVFRKYGAGLDDPPEG